MCSKILSFLICAPPHWETFLKPRLHSGTIDKFYYQAGSKSSRFHSVCCWEMTITVRRARTEDAAAIAVCLAPLGYDTPATLVAEKLATLMGSSSDTVLVADYPVTGIVGVVS